MNDMPRDKRTSDHMGRLELKILGGEYGHGNEIFETAYMIFKQAHEKNILKGRNTISVADACYLLSMEAHNKPYGPQTFIERASYDDMSQVIRDKKEVVRQVDINDMGIELGLVTPQDLVDELVDGEEITDETKSAAKQILNKTTINMGGKSPSGLAAAAIYLASLYLGEKITQRRIADISGVTEVTIRNRYKEMKEDLGDENPLDNNCQ